MKKLKSFRSVYIILSLFFLTSVFSPTSSYALDRKLNLLFKTAGYGAGAGALIGLGFFAAGVGDFKNVLMGASSGMYAGIALAGFVILTADADQPQKRNRVYGPRQRVEDDDWENENNDDEVLRNHIPRREDDEGARDRFHREGLKEIDQGPAKYDAIYAFSRTRFWAPVVQFQF